MHNIGIILEDHTANKYSPVPKFYFWYLTSTDAQVHVQRF